MLVDDIVKEYKLISNKKYVFVRAIHRFFFDRTFQVRVKINNMLKSRNESIKRIKRSTLLKKYGCDISLCASLGEGISLPHPIGVVIGERAVIGKHCTIYQNTTIGQKNGEYPVIGDNVTIFPSCVIIGGITVGDNAIVGAGSIVLHDVKPGTIVVGNPARELRKADGEE